MNNTLHMNHQDFVIDVLQATRFREPDIRKGQAVFNYIDETYGVARDVQFEDGIDCFYDDSKIYDFIEKAWDRYHTSFEQ